MTITFAIILIFAISGISVLWRKLLIDFPRLDYFLEHKLSLLGHALRCGFCYTYWLSLFAVLYFQPLEFVTKFLDEMTNLDYILSYVLSWMAIAFLTQSLRFVFIILQQLLVYFLHVLNVNLEHKH